MSATRAGGEINLPEHWRPDTTFHTPTAFHMQYRDERPKRDPLLDYPSEPHPLLDSLLNDALLRLCLVANGPIAAWDSVRVKQGARTSQAPGTYNGADIDRIALRYLKARTHRVRLTIISAAQEKARRLTHSQTAGPERGSAEWRRMIAEDPRPRREITKAYGVSASTVAAARREFGLTRAAGRRATNGTHVAASATVPYIQDARVRP